MAEYLKLFENHTDYEAYIADNPTTPNVSYCMDVRDVHYNPTIINFASSSLKDLLLTLGIDRNNDGEIDIYEAALYKGDFGSIFSYQGIGSETFSFNEFRFFTGLTEIPLRLFESTGLLSITIPDSVVSIGDEAFDHCLELTSITIPDSVTSIGQDAFYNCTSLTSITIPDSVTSIGHYAFQDCPYLTSVTVLAETPPTLGSSVFDNNASGRKIYVPAGSNIEAIPAAPSE